jgi:hypothetical protein
MGRFPLTLAELDALDRALARAMLDAHAEKVVAHTAGHLGRIKDDLRVFATLRQLLGAARLEASRCSQGYDIDSDAHRAHLVELEVYGDASSYRA